MVQTKELVPVVKPVTEVVFEFGAVIVPPPLITDQVVIPIAGTLALRLAVVVVKQNTWFAPALTGEAKSSS